MTQEHDIRLAYINTLLDSGYTRLLEGTENPTIGYIVGGVTKDSTMHEDETHYDFRSRYERTSRKINHYAQFKELWLTYAMRAPLYTDDDVYRLTGVGTWVHDGKIYFDLVQHFHNFDEATEQAKQRGEIAIYDCKNQKDILL
tara:strand:- start:220 stop:648 length:429 start_codon:yes stop_codon:yes gene_type:complete